MAKDFYEILEVARDANPEQIKEAYRKLAVKWHPDVNVNNRSEAVKIFESISRAFEVLSNPVRRELYNALIQTETSDVLERDFAPFRNPIDAFIQEFGKDFILDPPTAVTSENQSASVTDNQGNNAENVNNIPASTNTNTGGANTVNSGKNDNPEVRNNASVGGSASTLLTGLKFGFGFSSHSSSSDTGSPPPKRARTSQMGPGTTSSSFSQSFKLKLPFFSFDRSSESTSLTNPRGMNGNFYLHGILVTGGPFTSVTARTVNGRTVLTTVQNGVTTTKVYENGKLISTRTDNNSNDSL